MFIKKSTLKLLIITLSVGLFINFIKQKKLNMTTFNELGLNEQLLSAIQEMGFENPTEIQQKAIPIFLNRESDLVALAQTGTGKTAAFGLPILHHLDVNDKSTQALIISPTSELCMQITNDLKKLQQAYAWRAKIVAVYGGSSIMGQIKDIRNGAHIIVATPGRLIDFRSKSHEN
jgi:ATP-dependent RNA helicase DeaD